MSRPDDYGCQPPRPVNPGFSIHAQDVPRVGDVWQCGFCARWYVLTDRGLLYTNKGAPNRWWRPVYWFDKSARRKIEETI